MASMLALAGICACSLPMRDRGHINSVISCIPWLHLLVR